MNISFILIADKMNKGNFRTNISHITLMAINENPGWFELGLTGLPHLRQTWKTKDKNQANDGQEAAGKTARNRPDIQSICPFLKCCDQKFDRLTAWLSVSSIKSSNLIPGFCWPAVPPG